MFIRSLARYAKELNLDVNVNRIAEVEGTFSEEFLDWWRLATTRRNLDSREEIKLELVLRFLCHKFKFHEMFTRAESGFLNDYYPCYFKGRLTKELSTGNYRIPEGSWVFLKTIENMHDYPYSLKYYLFDLLWMTDKEYQATIARGWEWEREGFHMKFSGFYDDGLRAKPEAEDFSQALEAYGFGELIQETDTHMVTKLTRDLTLGDGKIIPKVSLIQQEHWIQKLVLTILMSPTKELLDEYPDWFDESVVLSNKLVTKQKTYKTYLAMGIITDG